jgi:transposase
MVFSSRAEREEYVIKLYEQGKTVREIAKEVHISFASIGSIIRRSKGEDKEQRLENNISKAPQALKLFSKGKELLEVAINLDLGAEEVERLYREYLQLKGLQRLIYVCDEIGDLLPSFMTLFNILKDERMMNEKDITDILKSAIELPIIKNRIGELTEEVNSLEHQRAASGAILVNSRDQISSLDDYLSLRMTDMNVKTQQIFDMKNEIAHLDDLIREIHEGDGYHKIQKMVEEKVNLMLTDANWILVAACTAVLETLRNDPTKQQLFESFDDLSSNSSPIMRANFEKYVQIYQEKTLEMAKKIYDRLLLTCFEDTMFKLMHPEQEK